jgi:hypothetical protein
VLNQFQDLEVGVRYFLLPVSNMKKKCPFMIELSLPLVQTAQMLAFRRAEKHHKS